jgi:hypothetical protein
MISALSFMTPTGQPREEILANRKSIRGYALTKFVLEVEIDRLVYELYGLTEEEIAMVEGK